MTATGAGGGWDEFSGRKLLVLSAFLGLTTSMNAMMIYALGSFIAPLQAEFGWARGDISFAVSCSPLPCSCLDRWPAASATGLARENERAGLSLPGVPDLSEYALKAVRAARATARLSGTPRQRVPAYVIVNDTHNAHVDRWMGVHVDGRDGASATVRLLGISAAKKVLADGAWKPTRRDKVAGLISVRVGRQKLR